MVTELKYRTSLQSSQPKSEQWSDGSTDLVISRIDSTYFRMSLDQYLQMVPLFKIKYTRPAALILNDSIGFERFAARAQMPLSRLDEPETIIPLAGLLDLYVRIARCEGTEFLIGGLMSCKSIDMLGQGAETAFPSSAFTVKSALMALNPYGKETNRGRTFLTCIKGGAWFALDTARFNPDTWLEDLVELQYLRILADTVLPGFVPRRVRIRAKLNVERNRILEKLGYTSFKSASSDIAIWIPEDLLARVITKFSERNLDPLHSRVSSRTPPADFVSVVLELLESYRQDRWLTLAELSECVDIPVRTIQRRLAEENTSFSDLSIQARISAATCMLRESEQSVTEIAMDLGFSSASNFARAFRSFTGFSPHRYRTMKVRDSTVANHRDMGSQGAV